MNDCVENDETWKILLQEINSIKHLNLIKGTRPNEGLKDKSSFKTADGQQLCTICNHSKTNVDKYERNITDITVEPV